MSEAEARADIKRTRRARTPVGIPFSTVQSVFAILHEIGGSHNALKSRLHHFRRLNFPDGVATGSGKHFAYGAADMIGLATVLELAEAFVPPSAAVAMVRTGWPEVARAASLGRDVAGPSSFVTFHSRALRAPVDETSVASVAIHAELEAAAGSRDGGPVLSLDVAGLTRRVIEALGNTDKRSQAILKTELETLARRFGVGRPLDRGEPTSGRLGGDGPFWDRARTLLDCVQKTRDQQATRRLRWFLDYLLAPPPVDAWKMCVEVVPDVSFRAAMAWWCGTAGLTAARTATSPDELDSVAQRLAMSLGSVSLAKSRLRQIVEFASPAE